MLKISWTEHKKNDEVLETVETRHTHGHTEDQTEEVVGTCATSWFFGENSVVRSTAREEGKREAKRNATELATGDKRRGHGLFTTQGASTRADKTKSMENANLPVRAEYNSSVNVVSHCRTTTSAA